MKSTLIKTFMAAHKFYYRITGGLIGHRAIHHRFLLLSTIGRRSGQVYITPLSYFKDTGNFILVASNWGRLDQPHWFNPVNQPETTIQIGRRKIKVRMKQASGGEYNRLWRMVTSLNRHYGKYQAGLSRQIPIVVLVPRNKDQLT